MQLRTRLSLTLALCALLAACGGGDGGGGAPAPDHTAPTATIDRAGPGLDKTDAIKITFSEAMNPSSLVLGGTLAAQADLSWSSSADTLTLAPHGGAWPIGPGSLTLAAADPAGNALAPLERDYVVRLELHTFDAAATVIGQSDFTSDVAATTDHNLEGPYGNPGVAPDGRFFVGDYGNNRVLGFAAVPDTNGASANLVLGAPDFTTQGAGGASQSTLGGPQQVVFAGNKMIVSEYDNDRVVIYNSVPADSSAVPDVVLGQPDFDTDNETCSPDSMVDPETVATTPDGKLVVTDSGNNRVLIWNSVPTQSGTLPNVVLGQGDFTHCMDNDDDQDGVDDSASARTLNGPAGIWTDGQRLVVSDTQNNRVLIWNTFPTSSFTPADVVLGQASMTANAENDDDQDGTADATPTARTLYGPYDGVASNGVQLAIADNNNNRVLVWNTFPTTNFQPADVVLGQGTFQGDTENDDAQTGTPGPLTARVLNRPSGVLFDRDRLIVVDESNNRLLVFKSH